MSEVLTESLVSDAFASLGIQVAAGDASGPDADLVVDPDGVRVLLRTVRRSLVTGEVAARLLAEPIQEEATLLVVGDRVTDAARHTLTARRGGYLDLRGRVGLRTGKVLIDAEVPAIGRRLQRSSALTGKAGLEVATALLMQPDRRWPVRALARELGRSASTVSEVLAALRRDGYIDQKNGVVDAGLFWEVATRWGSQATYLLQLPERTGESGSALRLGCERIEAEPGWALTNTVAAVSYGAPMAVRSDQVPDFYVPSEVIVRRAVTLLGAAVSAATAACVLRVAPVPAVCGHRVTLGDRSDWPLAHPLFVALDLAQDVGRGREVLEAWEPEGWSRVW